MRIFGYALIAASFLLCTGGVAFSGNAGTHALVAGASPSNPIATATAESHGPPKAAALLAQQLRTREIGQCSLAAKPGVRHIRIAAPGKATRPLNARGYNYLHPGEMRPNPAPQPNAPAAPDKAALEAR